MTKTAEEIRKQYVKSNKEAKVKLLKKYGIKSIDRILTVIPNKTGTMEVNMTELARVLLNHPSINLKVSFQKQLKWEDAYNEVMYSWQHASPIDFPKNLKKTIKNTINGIESTRYGFHNGKLDAFGRLYFVDKDIELDKSKSYDNRMILISLNHLNWVEVNGIKYILK